MNINQLWQLDTCPFGHCLSEYLCLIACMEKKWSETFRMDFPPTEGAENLGSKGASTWPKR